MNNSIGKKPSIVAAAYGALMVIFLLCPWVSAGAFGFSMSFSLLTLKSLFNMAGGYGSMFDVPGASEASAFGVLFTLLFVIGIITSAMLLQSVFTGRLRRLAAKLAPIALLVISLLFMIMVAGVSAAMDDLLSGSGSLVSLTAAPVLILVLSIVFLAAFSKKYAAEAGAAPIAVPAFHGEAGNSQIARPAMRPVAKSAAVPDFFGEAASGGQRFCPACGGANRETSKFCESCGAQLPEVAAQNPTEAAAAPQGQPAAAAAEMHAAPRKAPSKAKARRIVKIAVTAASAAVCVIVAISVMQWLGSPEKTAEDYFKAIASQDYEKAYGYLDVKSDDFINAQSFAASMSEKYGDAEIRELRFGKEAVQSAEDAGYAMMVAKYGDPMSYGQSAPDENSGLTKTVTVSYLTPGSDKAQTEEIRLVKGGEGAKWLRKYSVSAADNIEEGVTISVPVWTTLYVDGVEVSDSSTTPSSTSDSMDSRHSREYTVPRLFKGAHHITTESAVFAAKESDFETGGYYGPVSADSEPQLKPEIAQMLNQRAVEDAGKIYEGLRDGKAFGDLGLALADHAESLENMTSWYDSIRKDTIGDDNSNYHTTGITVTSQELKEGEYYPGYDTYATFVVTKSDIVYSHTNWNDERTDGNTASNETTIHLDYAYNGDAWVLLALESNGFGQYSWY